VIEPPSHPFSSRLAGILSSDPRRAEAAALLSQWRGLLPGYHLDDLIGIGGTSCVFLGTQESLGRQVAVKVLFPAEEGTPDFGGLLKREGRGIASLTHPNIIRVIDFGVMDARPYLVLEYVDAPSLACLLLDGPLKLNDALNIAIQCASALQHAHDRGICHRDLKPSNVLIDEQGHAWLLDFGIASLRQAVSMTHLTQRTLPHAGSMSYMPPERLRGVGEASPTEDIYALGVVLYEMLMGYPPHGAYPPIKVDAKAVPALDALVARALAHEPAQRWNSAAEMKSAMQAVAKGLGGEGGAGETRAEVSTTRTLWSLIGAGAILFISQCFLIGLSTEELFSLPAGPGSKLFDSAVALISCNGMLLIVWTGLLVLYWRKGRQHQSSPPPLTLVVSYLSIVFCISCVVYLAVKD
jgi:serine/threonine protein kinase